MRAVILAMVCAFAGNAAISDAPPAINIASFCTDPSSTDHTACIKSWVQAGKNQPQSKLYAGPGTYLYADTATIFSGMNVECANGNQATFKSIGVRGVLFEADAPVNNVRIANCGFDVNGNPNKFLAVISINHSGATPSQQVRLSHLRVFDSTIPGQMSAKVRDYLLVTDCVECSAEGNHLSEGGRIKFGRPGSNLVIRNNVIENANDNAITVVDIGLGTSQDILIEGNRVTGPKVTGIFFGVDGQGITGPSVTRDIRVFNNTVTGDWLLACIQGTLPSVAERIHIRENTCVKTGTAGQYQAGISINRASNATQRAENIKIERNHVRSPGCVSPGNPPLDYGGIFIAGNYGKVEVERNTIENVGPRALYLHDIDILQGKLVHNTIVGGVVVVQGSVAGPTSPNTVTNIACS